MIFNISISDKTCKPQQQSILIPIFLCVIFVLGFILNTMSLWTFWFRFKQWKTGMILQFNLALADAIIAPAAPLLITYFSISHWPFGQFLCQLQVFLLSTHIYGSVYFLTLISVHRYITVAHVTRVSMFKVTKSMKIICAAVWMFLFVQGLPFFFVLKTSELYNVTKCLSIHQTEHSMIYFVWSMVIAFPGFIIPVTVSITCYALLGSYIAKMNSSLSKKRAAKMKAMWMIVISLVVFIICCLPIQVTRITAVIVKLFYPEKCQLLYKMENSYYMTLTLVNLNCCLDPLLYWFLSKKFQESFKSNLDVFR
ncbi:P2Y purinoceptor 3-like [Callorhinchus milii]|uniref:P2Y purinoceptor 3-like n=1 Tax=Callorhinchus milii TaxID=7868 RepID=UPI0004573F35|nr:P2Y purinoceptor 3-like [Callorhinchus milii]XP_007894432.1 P2Y purinoceptor 3-like [Callorhinchus milii]|eukprot:gi/632957354/ref/XP_007894431.1/ PREDICTED: P2Y purinoceptor 3-like [Callorhinchus milii]